MGDMNGHVGNVAGVGIVGNTPKINPNGRQLLNFLKDAEMQMINRMCKKKERQMLYPCLSSFGIGDLD